MDRLFSMEACRASLTGDVFRSINVAKWWFHASVYIPALLYHAVGPRYPRRPALFDAVPRYPATISWTVRRGLPRLVFTAVWLMGWLNLIRPFFERRTKGCSALAWFLLQMLCAGFVGMVLAPVGCSANQNSVHHAAAALYILGHAVVVSLLEVRAGYARGFHASLFTFFACTAYSKHYQKTHKLEQPPGLTNDHLRLARGKMPPHHRDAIRAVELAEMAAEYGIFLFFITGLDTGFAAS